MSPGRAGSELPKIYNKGAMLVEGFWFVGASLRVLIVKTSFTVCYQDISVDAPCYGSLWYSRQGASLSGRLLASAHFGTRDKVQPRRDAPKKLTFDTM
jgi:hypothetical protein